MKEYRYEIDGKKYRVRIREIHGEHAVVQVNNLTYHVNFSTAQVPDPGAARPMETAAVETAPAMAPARVKQVAAPVNGAVTAPMPGVILKVLVDEGDMVNAGDPVMIIEAMKMENEIKAPVSGTILKIMVEPGDSVNTGDMLIKIST